VIAKSGLEEAVSKLPPGIRNSKEAVAETIANNVRRKIIKEHLNDPSFYNKMSVLLKEILDDLSAKRIDYEKFLKKIAEIAKQVQGGAADDTPEPLKKSPGLRALYNQLRDELTESSDNLGESKGAYAGATSESALQVAMSLDVAIKSKRHDGWRGVQTKEREIKRIIHDVVLNPERVERLYGIVFAQREY